MRPHLSPVFEGWVENSPCLLPTDQPGRVRCILQFSEKHFWLITPKSSVDDTCLRFQGAVCTCYLPVRSTLGGSCFDYFCWPLRSGDISHGKFARFHANSVAHAIAFPDPSAQWDRGFLWKVLDRVKLMVIICDCRPKYEKPPRPPP